MKGTVIEWAPVIIAGVLFAGTVGVIGYNSATNFLYLTNTESAESQLNNLYRDVQGLCSTPGMPGRTTTMEIPELSSLSGGDGELHAELNGCSSSSSGSDSEWDGDDAQVEGSLSNDCHVDVVGFDSDNSRYEVDISAQESGDGGVDIEISGTRIGEAQCS